MKKVLKKNKFIIVLLILVIIFFSSSLVVTFDSTHYLTYVNILEKKAAFSTWDIVRGPIFPILIFLNNYIFGRSSLGMLLGMFIFYLLYCFVVYKIIKETLVKTKYNKILTFILCAFAFLNPIVLGYFHTMLTEYVAITLTMTSLYLGWKWPNIKSKREKILYGLYFVFGLMFAYHLKQPYLCAVFIPMLFSIIYVFINHGKKLYYITTLIISIIMLALSIVIWNNYLDYKGVDLNTGRDSEGMLSSQLLKAIDGYKLEELDNYKTIKNDKYLTIKEKKEIKKEVKLGNSVYLVSIYDNNKLLEKDVLKLNKNNRPSSKNAAVEITKTFFKHPGIVTGSYAKNYCGLSSVCLITSNDGINYSATTKIELLKMYENEMIPFKSFKYEEKNFYYPEERHEFVKDYLSPINQGLISKIITLTFGITSVIFKFVTFLSFVFIIALITMRIIKRKRLNNKNLYLLSLMLLSFSFLTMVANAIVCSIIDRYAVLCFIPSLLGVVGTIIFMIENISTKKTKKIKSKE